MRLGFVLLLGACSRSTEPAPIAKPFPSATTSVAKFAPTAPTTASEQKSEQRCITPESVGAQPLVESRGSSALEQRALVAARAELQRVLEAPGEFFAVVQATDDLVLLELWHRSAFSPEHCNELGNPGGKCRTFGYDPKRGRITSTKFWQ